MNRLTYGTRLTIAYTAIFAAGLLTFCAVAYAVLAWTLHAQLVARIETTATAIRSVPDVRNGRLLFDADDRAQFLALLAENRVNGVTMTRDGRVLLSNLARPPLPIERLAAGPVSRSGSVSLDDDIADYRMYPLWHDDRQYGWIVAWASRALNAELARTTALAFLAVSIVLIGLAALLGRALVARMLQPIVDLNAMMAATEVGDLSERLAWHGPDDELGRLCTTFDRLLDRLEAAFERERRFTADASHELRTPLGVMRAEIELALARTRDAESYRRTLTRLQAETTRLETLVESLLLSAQGDALPTRQPLALHAIAERVADRLALPAGAAGVALRVDAPCEPSVTGDPALLESAALAIVDNAIRHSPSGGVVRIAVAGDDERATLSVADEGRGFSERALHEATLRFWRDDAARAGRGTGLGLSIAGTIAERHGGSLRLENGAAGGAIVTIALPAVTAERPLTVTGSG